MHLVCFMFGIIINLILPVSCSHTYQKQRKKNIQYVYQAALKAVSATSPYSAEPVKPCITHLTLYYFPPEHTLSHY